MENSAWLCCSVRLSLLFVASIQRCFFIECMSLVIWCFPIRRKRAHDFARQIPSDSNSVTINRLRYKIIYNSSYIIITIIEGFYNWKHEHDYAGLLFYDCYLNRGSLGVSIYGMYVISDLMLSDLSETCAWFCASNCFWISPKKLKCFLIFKMILIDIKFSWEFVSWFVNWVLW